MPKKAVAIFFSAALLGAIIFVYFTFPRTKDEIPRSNNQRAYPSAPVPDGVPVPEPAPAPNTPKLPPGPKLHVMTWASPSEAQALQARADAFTAATGREVSFTIQNSPQSYRQDLQDAMASSTPPDVCMIDSRDFCGLNATIDFARLPAPPESAPRSVAAFTVDGHVKAAPAEYSVDVLYYNPVYFDQAGLGYPSHQWTWDMLESITRALSSKPMKNASDQPVYALELSPTFELWNILCAQDGHPALDLGNWHLTEAGTKEAQVRALSQIYHLFQELAVTTPGTATNAAPGQYFARQQAAIFIGPSELAASLPKFAYGFTVLPSDLTRASQARVNGWAVVARSTDPDAAQELATYLAYQPLHAGWNSVQKPSADDASATLCYETLSQSLVPRVDQKNAPLAQFLDQQIRQLAQNTRTTVNDVYDGIQHECQSQTSARGVETGVPQAPGIETGLPKASSLVPAPQNSPVVPLRGI